MEIISLHNQYEQALATAAEVLEGGGVVVVPTDTVYGLVGDARSERVVKEMFAIKNRPAEKAFPIFVKDIPAARMIAYISDKKAQFLEKVWPGQVTVVFDHKKKLPDVLTGGMQSLGMRIPDHAFLCDLMQHIDFPLAQTSANISSQSPAKNRTELECYFLNASSRPDLIIDGGEVAGQSSVVIDFTEDELLVLRTGMITKEKLDQILKGF